MDQCDPLFGDILGSRRPLPSSFTLISNNALGSDIIILVLRKLPLRSQFLEAIRPDGIRCSTPVAYRLLWCRIIECHISPNNAWGLSFCISQYPFFLDYSCKKSSAGFQQLVPVTFFEMTNLR
jgi:hypothetical protein